MAAITSVSTVTGVKNASVGNRTVTTRKIVFGANYVTGGVVVTAAQCGLSRIQHGGVARITAGFASGFAHVDALAQTNGTVKLRLRAAAGTEVASDGDASTVTAIFDVQGY